MCNFLLVGLCLSWKRTVNDIYFFLTFIFFYFFRIFALSVCRHVWLINITIFSVEALPWNLIVQDHWRWGLSIDHIVSRACVTITSSGVCFVSKQLASTSFRRQVPSTLFVQRWRGSSGKVRLSNPLISSGCWLPSCIKLMLLGVTAFGESFRAVGERVPDLFSSFVI